MDAVQLGCDVASTTWQSWHQIPWSDAHQVVARLQTRIAKAAKAGEWRKVRSLQGLLTRSTSAKALAVRRVTENRGRKTPGVDGRCWDTPDDKWHAVKSQGGIISPVLANCALDGLQHELETLFATVRQARAAKVNLVRYADDCVPRRHEREVYMN